MKKERTTMLRQQKHYSEGIQGSSSRTLRNQTKGNVYGIRIIYIISLFTILTKNQYRQIKQYCENSLYCGLLGDIVGGISLFALLFLALIFGGVLQ
jgi:hypothetical protein